MDKVGNSAGRKRVQPRGKKPIKQSVKRPPNGFMKFLKTPKGLVLCVLTVLAIVACFAAKGIDTRALMNCLLGVITGFVIDLVVGLFYQRKGFISDGGIITGLIVAMVLSSFSPWYVVVVTTAIALVSKHLIRMKRKPIFNPAAFGLFLSTFLFQSMQSWWGGMSLVSGWYLIVLVAAGLWVTKRVRKFPQVIAFMATYAIFALVLLLFKHTHDDALFALQNPMLNSALFLAFFMLTDPPTSPAKARDQVWFGVVTAFVSVGVYMLFPAELTYLLIGLMVANVIKFVHSLFAKPVKHRRRGPASSMSQGAQ